MTHSERDVQIVLSEHPEVAERIIDEMDRAGRDYMRLREVEALLAAKDAEIERLKAHAEMLEAYYVVAEAYILRLRQIVYSQVPGVPERAHIEIADMLLASNVQAARMGINAAREKGGGGVNQSNCPTNLTWQEQYPTTYVYSSPPEIEHLKRVVREKGGA